MKQDSHSFLNAALTSIQKDAICRVKLLKVLTSS